MLDNAPLFLVRRMLRRTSMRRIIIIIIIIRVYGMQYFICLEV